MRTHSGRHHDPALGGGQTRLDRFERERESYEDVVVRLTERDQWAGFGVLADTETDTREGIYRVYVWLRDGGED